MKNRLKELRMQHLLSLRQLADKVSISHSALSLAENGKRNLTDNDIKIFCDFYGVSADYLLGNTDNPKLQTITVADADGTITKVQHELLDAIKDFTDDDMQEVLKYIEFIKMKKGNNINEK